jgi:hypothetical protein
MSRTPIPLFERLVRRVDFDGPCWEWTGARTKDGYGLIGLGGRVDGLGYTHRVMWEALVGPIPAGLDIDHLCRVRHCCNPDHLDPVSRLENVRRGIGPALKRGVTHCQRGHRFTPENTIQSPRQRRCRTCHNARNRASRKEKNAA